MLLCALSQFLVGGATHMRGTGRFACNGVHFTACWTSNRDRTANSLFWSGKHSLDVLLRQTHILAGLTHVVVGGLGGQGATYASGWTDEADSRSRKNAPPRSGITTDLSRRREFTILLLLGQEIPLSCRQVMRYGTDPLHYNIDTYRLCSATAYPASKRRSASITRMSCLLSSNRTP